MSINKKSLRYILYTLPILLLIIFPLVMGCIVYSINLNSKQLDINKSLIEYVNDYLPFNANYNYVDVSTYRTLEYFTQYLQDNLDSKYYTNHPNTRIIDFNLYYDGLKIIISNYNPLPEWRLRCDSGDGYSTTDYFFDYYEWAFSYISSDNIDTINYFLNITNCGDVRVGSASDQLRSVLLDYISLARYGSSSGSFDIIYNNTPTTSILTDVYMNLFNNLVLPTSSNLGLPYYLFNYMFYVLGIFILYILFIFFIYVPKCLICLLDKSIDKLSGGNNV